MAKDLFGGLGNLGALGDLVSGLAKSGLAPKDDPSVKLINAQSEISDLQKQEAEILSEIGTQAFAQNPNAWPQADKLNLIRSNLKTAEEKAHALTQEHEATKQAQEAADAAKAAEDAKGRCASCGCKNPDGVKFCQECGSPLAAAGPKHCTSCGAELAPGTRFCGECGAGQG